MAFGKIPLIFLALILIPVAFSLQITEVMYDPPGTDEGHEWLEVYNNESEPINLSLWKFFEGGSNHTLAFKQGSQNLSAGEYAIVADSWEIFLQDFLTFNKTLFDSSWDSLSNSGEFLAFRNPAGEIKENITYNTSIGAAGTGESLSFVNGTWLACNPSPGQGEICEPLIPLETNVKLEINLGERVSMNFENDNLFKITIENKADCSIYDTIIVEYNLTKSGNLTKSDTFTKDDVGCTKTASTGEWTPDEAGIFQLCGKIISTSANNSNPADDEACKEIEVMDTSTIPCDLELSLQIPEDLFFIAGEQIEYYILVNDTNCNQTEHPVGISYKIEDLFADEKLSRTTEQELNPCDENISRSWIPSSICGSEAYFISAEISQPFCNDSNFSNNEASHLIVVKGSNPSGCSQSSTSSSGKKSSSKTTAIPIKTFLDLGISVLSYPREVAQGQPIQVQVEVRNPGAFEESVDIQSYVYLGTKSASGSQTENKQRLELPGYSKTALTLHNTISKKATPGDYTLNVRISQGKLEVEKKEPIKILQSNQTEPEKTSSSKKAKEKVMTQNQSAQRVNQITGGVVQVSAISQKSKNVLYILLALSVFLNILLLKIGRQ